MFHLSIHIEIATATVGKQEAGGGYGANDALYGIDRVFHTAQHLGDGGGDRACRRCMIGNGSAVFTVTEGNASADSHNGNRLAVAELYGGFGGGFGFAAVNDITVVGGIFHRIPACKTVFGNRDGGHLQLGGYRGGRGARCGAIRWSGVSAGNESKHHKQEYQQKRDLFFHNFPPNVIFGKTNKENARKN